MIRLGKYLLAFYTAVLVAWIVPWAYRFLTTRADKAPFVLYSPVIHDFALLDHADGETVRRDLQGRTYTEQEFDSILPLFYYRQLMADGRLPAELQGVPLTPKLIQTESFNFRHVPADRNKPLVGLHPLLESRSGRVDLEMPGDVFRITGERIEFIDMARNMVNEEKSRLFTRALLRKGFAFPARIVAGNPTARKDYDEGYLLLDREGRLYHMKQVVGRPFVRHVPLPEGTDVRCIFLTEFRNRKTLAFLTDSHNRLYALLAKSYRLQPLPVDCCDPVRQRLTVIGNLLDWTIAVSDDHGNTYYAVDAQDYHLLKKWECPAAPPTPAERIGRWLMPLRLTFTSPLDKWVKPRGELIIEN